MNCSQVSDEMIQSIISAKAWSDISRSLRKLRGGKR